MPRSQPSPGGAFPPEPPLSPSVSPASADRGRKKSGSGHRRRGSWSLERPRAHSFDEAEGRALDDSDSDLNTLPTPARKQRRSTGRVRRFLRHEANVVKGGYKATKRNVGRFGRFLTKPMRPGRGRDEGDKAAREIPATPRRPARRTSPGRRCGRRCAPSARRRWWWPRRRRPSRIKAAFCGCHHHAGRARIALRGLRRVDESGGPPRDHVQSTRGGRRGRRRDQGGAPDAGERRTSDEQGTWAPGKGADFAVRSSTYLDNGVKKPSAEPLYTVGVAGFAMSAGAVANGTQAYPEVLEKLRGEDADRDVFTDASSPPPKYVMITMNSPLEAPSLRKKAKGEKTAVFVFALRRNDAAIAKAPKAAVALATKWLSDAPNDPGLSGRLKGIFHGRRATACRTATREEWNGSARSSSRRRQGLRRRRRGGSGPASAASSAALIV